MTTHGRLFIYTTRLKTYVILVRQYHYNVLLRLHIKSMPGEKYPQLLLK